MSDHRDPMTCFRSRSAGEIERTLAVFAGSPNGGLIVTGSASAAVHRDLVIRLAAQHKLPAVYFARYFDAQRIEALVPRVVVPEPLWERWIVDGDRAYQLDEPDRVITAADLAARQANRIVRVIVDPPKW